MAPSVLIAIENIAGLARPKSTHGKRLDKVEGDLEKHTESGELRRNPDFERRLDRISCSRLIDWSGEVLDGQD